MNSPMMVAPKKGVGKPGMFGQGQLGEPVHDGLHIHGQVGTDESQVVEPMGHPVVERGQDTEVQGSDGHGWMAWLGGSVSR